MHWTDYLGRAVLAALVALVLAVAIGLIFEPCATELPLIGGIECWQSR